MLLNDLLNKQFFNKLFIALKPSAAGATSQCSQYESNLAFYFSYTKTAPAPAERPVPVAL